ncbi:MAG: hypothetical protein AAFZ63_22135 [Bacteroidota bacterium]
MPNQRLIETLRCFSDKERKRLVHFVESAYHNDKYNRPKTIQLLQYLLNTNLSDGDIPEQKEALQQLFFAQKPFLKKRKNAIDSLASDLFSLTKLFVLHEQEYASDKRKWKEQLTMIRFYRTNNLEHRFWQAVEQFRRMLEKVPTRGEKYYQYLLELEEEVVSFQTTFNTYTGDSNLVRAHLALDKCYTIAKLEKAAVLLFQQKLGQIQTDDALLLNELLIETFAKYPEIQTPLAKLYYLIIRLLQRSSDQELMAEFVQNVKALKNQIPAGKYRNIMAFYRYFLGLQYQQESRGPELLQRLFSLYREHLQAGYFDVEKTGQILPGSLKLMTNIAIKVGDFEWADQLLTAYGPGKITGTRFPIEAHSLCQAEVLFARELYTEALDHIMYRNFEDINYSILADVLLIKIYFVKDHNLLESRISALAQKVRRTKLTQAHKQQYLNFFKVMNLLCKYRWSKLPAELSKLQSMVKDLAPLLEREWLKKRINSV